MKNKGFIKSVQYRRITMKKYILFSIILLAPFMLHAEGKRINVPDDFAKIQDAINSADDGDTIVVAPGTYYENINFRGKNILLSSHYLFDEDVSFINTTIIDGSNPQSPDTASVVSFFNGEENTAILQGFTIAGGKGTKNLDLDGNFLVRTGGGIIIYQSSPTIRHNIIAFNEVINKSGVSHCGGGGIVVTRSGAIIRNNIIYKNNSNDGGGLILGRNSGTVIRNNIIAYNTTNPTSIGGGGIFIFGQQGQIINNTIAYNHSNKRGGIEIQDGATVNLENCIIYGNKTGSTNTQLGGNGTFNVTNSNIEGGWAGDGNIDESPLFIDNTPLILQDGSPCVDLGDTSTANNDWEDPDNPGFPLPPALGTLRNDMGAYGGNQYKSMPYMHMLEPTKIIVENFQNKSDFVPGADTVIISSRIVSPE